MRRLPDMPGGRAAGRPGAGAAWRHGVRAALRCGNLMAVVLATGVLGLRVMAVVTVAIAAERLVPAGGERVARMVVGGVAIGAGFVMIMCAAGLGRLRRAARPAEALQPTPHGPAAA
ncbi:DUF2182 domain-containing protein [Burkholderia anthina]|uniref:copper chaperone n=1 Tax=Burkholderia anthina TaxID=179879 RepID=UPI002A23A7D8|nr:DUF2182 domain-containing protein [Burkholderia anthina]